MVDMAGAPHALGRRVGEKAKTVKQRMADLDPASLPDVAQAREMQLELARSHQQAQAERQREQAQEAEQAAAKEVEAPPQALAPEHDTRASEKRKRKQEITAQLDKQAAQEKQREAEQRRQQAIERRKQLDEARRLAADRADRIKAELEQRENQGILGRAREAITSKLAKAAGWMRGLGLFGGPPAPQPPRGAEQQAGDAAQIPQKSEQQHLPEPERKREKTRYKIIDLDAITAEREAREKAEGKDKSRDKQQDKGQGLERTRDRGGRDDDER